MNQMSHFEDFSNMPSYRVELQSGLPSGLIAATAILFGVAAAVLFDGPDTVSAAPSRIEERVVSADLDSRLKRIEETLAGIISNSERTTAALGDVKLRLKSVLDATGDLRPVPGEGSFEGWKGYTQDSQEALRTLKKNPGSDVWVYLRSIR